jgi:hypothetical protein
MIILEFNVNCQIIKRKDILQKIIADSKNQIKCKFTFSDEWVDKAKTAVIKTGGTTYNILITDDEIAPDKMPVLKAGIATFSVFGGDLMTANIAKVPIEASGLEDGQTPEPPEPDIYNQILTAANEAKTIAQGVAQQATDGEFDGDYPVVRTNETHIQWKLSKQDDTKWSNLYPLANLKGTDAKNIQVQTNETHIQWKLVGDDEWIDLIELSLLKGRDGHTPVITISENNTWVIDDVDTGKPSIGASGKKVLLQKSATHLQWKHEDDAEWIDLVPLSELKGLDAVNVEFQATATHIQWRYIDGAWQNLFVLSSFAGLYLALTGGTMTGALKARPHGTLSIPEVINVGVLEENDPNPDITNVPNGTIFFRFKNTP